MILESPVEAAPRTESVVVGGQTIASLTGHASEGPTPSQRALAVSPGGDWLAFADTYAGSVRLRNARGREILVSDVHGGDLRFSADGDSVAVVRRGNVVVVDLPSGRQRVLANVRDVLWIEWVVSGL